MALGPNGKIILGPREQKSWTTLMLSNEQRIHATKECDTNYMNCSQVFTKLDRSLHFLPYNDAQLGYNIAYF